MSAFSSKITAIQIRRFLGSVALWALKGFKTVDQAEADRRAAICARCPSNKRVAGCLSCGGIRKMVDRLKGDRSTPFDNDLHACEECGCELKVKVWLPLDAVDNTGVTFPDHCWNEKA